jgi:hypothetical protein
VATVPDLTAIRAYIGVPEPVLPDDQLQQIVDSELSIQATKCRIPQDPTAYPPEAVQGLFRRVARVVAARALPLGMMGAESEFGGAARLPRYDAEIARIEGPITVMVFG